MQCQPAQLPYVSLPRGLTHSHSADAASRSRGARGIDVHHRRQLLSQHPPRLLLPRPLRRRQQLLFILVESTLLSPPPPPRSPAHEPFTHQLAPLPVRGASPRKTSVPATKVKGRPWGQGRRGGAAEPPSPWRRGGHGLRRALGRRRQVRVGERGLARAGRRKACGPKATNKGVSRGPVLGGRAEGSERLTWPPSPSSPSFLTNINNSAVCCSPAARAGASLARGCSSGRCNAWHSRPWHLRLNASSSGRVVIFYAVTNNLARPCQSCRRT